MAREALSSILSFAGHAGGVCSAQTLGGKKATLKDYALFNLVEAKEAIEQLVADMPPDSDYDEANYSIE